jgi:uncharacterized protein (TIGR00730 family)
MKISVYGAGSPTPNSEAYSQAYNLGSLLAINGHILITGGYSGTMEATSKGAQDSGGEVWGYSCKQIEDWRPISPNLYIDKLTQFATLQERIYALISACDMAIALPGGIGTLAEISLLWTHLQTNSLADKPLILIGEGWKNILAAINNNQHQYITQGTYQKVSFSPTVTDVLKYLS